jgi:hypothetical protein
MAKEFTCPACGAEFDTREKLEAHGQREYQAQGQRGQPRPETTEGSPNLGGSQPDQSSQRPPM